MRLIDADALAKELMHEGLGYQYNRVINAPAVDAVPVIRCKECTEHGKRTNYCAIWRCNTSPDGYCHRGRK